jgi:hypothetical protein
MKAISLPVNIIILVSVAVLALVTIVSFLLQNADVSNFYVESAHSKACISLKTINSCKDMPDEIIADNKTLSEICILKGISGSAECMESCGCSVADNYPLATQEEKKTIASGRFRMMGVATP